MATYTYYDVTSGLYFKFVGLGDNCGWSGHWMNGVNTYYGGRSAIPGTDKVFILGTIYKRPRNANTWITFSAASQEAAQLVESVRIESNGQTVQESANANQGATYNFASWGDGLTTSWTIDDHFNMNDLRATEISYSDHQSMILRVLNGFLANPPDPDPPEDDDPYSNIGDSDAGGGDGTFGDTSVPVPIPSLPTISVADSGFVSILTPSLSQLQNLAAYMWTGAFDPTNFKKIVANPLDVFIGLSILPVAVPHTTTKRIRIGGIDTGIDMNLAAAQFVDVDFGTLTIDTALGNSYLDYSPYTKASIFLPYIGWRDIDTDEIMGKSLKLVYHVDIVTGGCVAYLECGGTTLYEWSGQCSINIPLTSIDWSNTYSAALSAVGHVASAVVGGVSQAMNPIGVAGSVFGGASSLASDVMNSKPQFPRSGSLGGPSGVMGHQEAYIALTRPNVQKPRYQAKFVGYPSFVTREISDLVGKGFNAFSEVILEDIGLTDSEMSELKTLLKGGVYL